MLGLTVAFALGALFGLLPRRAYKLVWVVWACVKCQRQGRWPPTEKDMEEMVLRFERETPKLLQ